MANNTQKKIGFEPLHDAHAIEQVVFAIQFDGQLDDAAFKEITDVLEPITADLPKKDELFRANLTFAVGNVGAPPLGVVASRPTPPVAYGKTYKSIERDGTIGNEFTVDRNSIVFRTTLYTRWADTWLRGRTYCEAILGKYLAKVGITSVSLNYMDKFVWNGLEFECRPSFLLNPKSKYLCPHVYETAELWHSHTGAFSHIDGKTKRLLNVNVDHLEERKHDKLQRVIAIGTVLSDLMNQPGYEKFEIAAIEGNAFLGSKMQQLHDFGKAVLAEIINSDMSKRIALNI